MGFYRYKAVDRYGKRIEGEIEAESRLFVFERLNELGHLPVEVEAISAEHSTLRGTRRKSWLARGPSRAQVTLLTRELAMLLKAGLTLDGALALLEEEGRANAMRSVVTRLRYELSEGRSFADALAAQGDVFPEVYCNMVRVAEASGRLQEVLEQIAAAREQEQKIRTKMLSALLYPSFLVVSAIAIVTLLLVYVIPRFKLVIADAGAETPESARLVIAASDWLNAHGTTLALGLLALFLVVRLALRLEGFAHALQSLLFRLPVIGRLLKANMTIVFSRSLATLLNSGIELPMALDLSRRLVRARPAARAIEAAVEALRKGQDFIAPLAGARLFDPTVINLLRVGEESGNLAESASYLAEMYEEKADVLIKRILIVLEPAIIILVSLLVAGIVIAILSAIISVNDLVA